MFAAIDPYILGFSLITVVVTIWMGFRSAKSSKSAADFFVAGRSVSVGWNASAISGEYLSAASFMGVAGMVMSSGYDALWYPVCYACGYLFLLLFIAGPLRRFGAYTIPDFAEGRYDSPVFRKIAVVFVLFIGFFYTMPQMKGAGTTLAYIFKDIDFNGHKGLPYWVGVVLVGAVITLNVALGGMKGITLIQAFQYWAKMFAISVPVFVLMSVYGGYGKQLGVNGGPPQMPSSSVTDTSGFVAVTQAQGLSERLEQIAEPLRTPQPRKLTFPQYPLVLALGDYASYSGRGLIARTNLDLGREVGPFTLTYTQRMEAVASVSNLLVSRGIALLPASGGRMAAVSADEAKEIAVKAGAVSARQPLPVKAPKDETWLNPFGPLTTKAAKAAKPKWIYSGPLVVADNHRPVFSWAVGTYFDLRQRLRGHDFSLATNRVPATNLLNTYTGNKKLSRLAYAPSLTNITVDLVLKPAMSWNELNNEMLSSLERAGIAVDLGATSITAFPKADGVSVPLDARPYALLYTYSLIIALVCGTAGLPHILVRFYTNPDGVAAKRTTMWVMILIGVFYVFPPVFGALGRNLMPSLYDGVGVNGTDGIVLKLPAMLGERYGVLGSVLSGITCAGAFAAFMSTFSGLLVSMTGALAHDVYGRILRPRSTAADRMRMFKFCAVAVGTVAVLLGTLVENFEINFMVGQAFAIAAASYFPLLFMSVWWRGMTTRGAATGMLAGGMLAVAAISLTSWTTFITTQAAKFKSLGVAEPAWFEALKPWSLTGYWAEHPLLRILCEQPAIWAVPLAITLMVVVSKLTRSTIPADIRMKMLVLHAPEKLGLKQEYIKEHAGGH